MPLNVNPFSEYVPEDTWLFNSQALQEYILLCCQDHRYNCVMCSVYIEFIEYTTGVGAKTVSS